MQRQQLYSFSFLEWAQQHKDGKYVGDFFQERVVKGVMVTGERTSKGAFGIKTRTNWDSEAVTRLEMDPITEDNYDNMKSCYYFWNCMQYAVVLCLVEEGMEDALYDAEGKELLDRASELPYPKYGDDSIDYFKLLSNLYPTLEITKIDNGY